MNFDTFMLITAFLVVVLIVGLIFFTGILNITV